MFPLINVNPAPSHVIARDVRVQSNLGHLQLRNRPERLLGGNTTGLQLSSDSRTELRTDRNSKLPFHYFSGYLSLFIIGARVWQAVIHLEYWSKRFERLSDFSFKRNTEYIVYRNNEKSKNIRFLLNSTVIDFFPLSHEFNCFIFTLAHFFYLMCHNKRS